MSTPTPVSWRKSTPRRPPTLWRQRHLGAKHGTSGGVEPGGATDEVGGTPSVLFMMHAPRHWLRAEVIEERVFCLAIAKDDTSSDELDASGASKNET
jgi:hypothetical protein